MRPPAALLAGAMLVASGPARALPDFVPKPSTIYERYSALQEPRAEVPVGALWVQGYGAVGEGAAPENLETVKSLTGIAISRDLELSLTAGILRLVGIDPAYRSRVNARFSELSIVRVKDPAKLAGPAGEARIVESLKAGTITITTDSDIGLDLRNGPDALGLPVLGRADSGRRKSWSIDGRDLFIAFRVARLKPVKGKEESVPLKEWRGGWRADLGDYGVMLAPPSTCECKEESASECADGKLRLALYRDRPDQPPGELNWSELDKVDSQVVLPLPVPKADGKGGLFMFIRLMAKLDGARVEKEKGRCTLTLGQKSRLTRTFEGSRLENLEEAKAPNW